MTYPNLYPGPYYLWKCATYLHVPHLIRSRVRPPRTAPEVVVELVLIAVLCRVQQAHDTPELTQIVLNWRACSHQPDVRGGGRGDSHRPGLLQGQTMRYTAGVWIHYTPARWEEAISAIVTGLEGGGEGRGPFVPDDGIYSVVGGRREDYPLGEERAPVRSSSQWMRISLTTSRVAALTFYKKHNSRVSNFTRSTFCMETQNIHTRYPLLRSLVMLPELAIALLRGT